MFVSVLLKQGVEIIVATDDLRIFDVVTDLSIKAIMTHPDHQSGTERIAEVALCLA